MDTLRALFPSAWYTNTLVVGWADTPSARTMFAIVRHRTFYTAIAFDYGQLSISEDELDALLFPTGNLTGARIGTGNTS